MSQAEVLFERRGRLGLITLNRPEALNALTLNMTRMCDHRLRAWAKDDAIEAVAMRGAGERAFCAGGDIRKLYDLGQAGRYDEAVGFWREEYVLNALIHRFPKPFLSFIKGYVMGGGVGLCIHGSYRIGVGKIGFSMPEVGIGFFPDVGGTYFLPRLPANAGLWLGMTGARLDAPDALRLGLLTHAIAPEAEDKVLTMLSEGASPEEALAPFRLSPEAPIGKLLPEIERLFSGKSVEEILASLAKESDGLAAAFALAAKESIEAKSPTSLKLAVALFHRGKNLDFSEALKAEFRIAAHIVAAPDFYEGVRAVVIERGKAPLWQPATLAEVAEADIAAYFAPLGDRELVLA